MVKNPNIDPLLQSVNKIQSKDNDYDYD